jgi:hypothetical protein
VCSIYIGFRDFVTDVIVTTWHLVEGGLDIKFSSTICLFCKVDVSSVLAIIMGQASYDLHYKVHFTMGAIL